MSDDRDIVVLQWSSECHVRAVWSRSLRGDSMVEKVHLSHCLTCVACRRFGLAEEAVGGDEGRFPVSMSEVVDEVKMYRHLRGA